MVLFRARTISAGCNALLSNADVMGKKSPMAEQLQDEFTQPYEHKTLRCHETTQMGQRGVRQGGSM